MRVRSTPRWVRILVLLVVAAAGIVGAIVAPNAAFADQQPQRITFTSTPPNAYVGGPAYVVSATSSAGLPVGFSVDGTESVCFIAAYTNVYFTGVGTCTIDANNYGSTGYLPAPQVQQSFTVKAAQSVTFTSIPPNHAVVGTTYALGATSSVGLPVSYSIDPGSATMCSLSGSVVTFTQIGTCLLFATAPGNDTYGPGGNWQSFSVYGEPQTVAFTSTPPTDPVVGGPDYPLTAVASSGLAVTFVIYGTPEATPCYLSGSALVFFEAGTCTVDAIQNGNAYYAFGAAEQSFQVNAATDPPVITSASSNVVTAGGAFSFQVIATGAPAPTFTESGTLPSGVSFTVAGVLAGTPRAGTQGTYSVTISASNGIGSPAHQTFTLVVSAVPGSMQITTASLPNGLPGAAYSTRLSATGATAPYRWAVVSGSLPKGLRLSRVGLVAGRPKRTDTGTSTFTVEAASKKVRGVEQTGTKTLSITIL